VNLFPEVGSGRLVLMSSYQVAVLQEVVSYLTAIGLLLPLLTIVAFGAAVWASLWRRQTVIWIGSVMAVAMFVSLIVFSGVRSSALVSIQDPFLRELGRAIVNVVTHGLMVQTIFFLIVGLLLIIGGWQAAPDSALRRWDASRKEKEAAEAAQEPVE
jgi:amino acid transporter